MTERRIGVAMLFCALLGVATATAQENAPLSDRHPHEGWPPIQTWKGSCSVKAACKPVVPKLSRHECDALEEVLSKPGALISNGMMDLETYEKNLARWAGHFCYRAYETKGDTTKYSWARDNTARQTGPYVATVVNGQLEGSSYTGHAVARVWYSEDMYDWVKTRSGKAEDAQTLEDGAIMVKEMWPSPISRYPGACFDCMEPGVIGSDPHSVVIFVRDAKSFSSGWFAGYWGRGFRPDWPPDAANTHTLMGQGGIQFCINCHASAESANTFADISHVKADASENTSYLTQFVPGDPPARSRHAIHGTPESSLLRLGEPYRTYDPRFLKTYGGFERGALWTTPDWKMATSKDSPYRMPSQTFDTVLVPGGGPVDQFLTSSQCVGCHQGQATGLQWDMLVSNPHPLRPYGDVPVSVSPASLWSTSPMGLAGRDPIFFSQLESEQILHVDHTSARWKTEAKTPYAKAPDEAALLRAAIQDTCLQCHGNMAQRQHAIDTDCQPFARKTANAKPYPWDSDKSLAAKYGALARDGISCTTCHHLLLDYSEDCDDESDPRCEHRNRCVRQKQASLNPGLTKLASTFTGSFLAGRPDAIFGPFADPKPKPMQNALGVTPVHRSSTTSSEMCGSCHTIHLPVLDREIEGCEPDTYDPMKPYDAFKCNPKRYEQTTYAEWVFSDYRTGTMGEESLPLGAGKMPKSCQDCHMEDRSRQGDTYKSKVASIREYSNYPVTERRLPPADVDLPMRDNYSRHSLVGLNLFFIEMAQQFPDVLGIRTRDPGLEDQAVPPLIVTEEKMLEQAAHDTVGVYVSTNWHGTALRAKVQLDNKVGHKFPSGVSFRRAFVEFTVLDGAGRVLWASGRTNESGVIVDRDGAPIQGELWWKEGCSGKNPPDHYQRHHERITEQSKAQIYQELIHNREGEFTTSFLSIDCHVKDNRLQPHGFLKLEERYEIAVALGDGTPLAPERHACKDTLFPPDESISQAVAPHGRALDDLDYKLGTGTDTLEYVVERGELDCPPEDDGCFPARVQAKVFYQAIPPFFLQDRFCTAQMAKAPTTTTDTERLYFLTGHLNLDDTEVAGWKLKVADSGRVRVPRLSLPNLAAAGSSE